MANRGVKSARNNDRGNETEMDLSCMNLNEITPGVTRNDKLTSLDLEGNKLSGLPDDLANLHFLEKLTLRCNRFTAIPKVVYSLNCLSYLDAGFNCISAIDDDISRLGGLETLILDFNQLETITEETGKLVNLRVLDISGNNLTEVPDCLMNIWGLRELRLSCNKISELPSNLSNLDSLEVLKIAGNLLTEVPELIGAMKHLKEMYMDDNLIRKFKCTMASLANLETLSLRNNKLKSLPPEFGKLWSMKDLDLSYNQLREFPEDFTYLEFITRLSISNNNIKHLPDDISRLSSLEQLYVNNNKIKCLPESLVHLQSLYMLVAHDNKLRQLPPEFSRLVNLRFLHLDANRISILPVEILCLESLEHLGLRRNRLKEIPKHIIRLTKLEKLSISYNKLQQRSLYNILPMKNVTELYLSNNALTDIPSLFSIALPKLEYFDVVDNPLPEPLMEACDAGIIALREYLDSLEDDVAEDPYFNDVMEDSNRIVLVATKKVSKTYHLPSGYVLQLPPGSLKKNVHLDVTCENELEVTKPPLKDYEFYQSEVLDFSPRDVKFDKPVTLRRKGLHQDVSDRVLVVMQYTRGKGWEELPTTSEDDTVKVQISQLGVFIAVSRPFEEKFWIGKNESTIPSQLGKHVTIEVQAGSVECRTHVSLEVHPCDSDFLDDVFDGCDEPVNAEFAPMVYVNREQPESLRFQRPVTLTIPLPSETPSFSFPGGGFDDTELRIVQDEYDDGDWVDVTDTSTFNVSNGVVKLLRQNFSGCSAVRVRKGDRKAGEYCRTMTKHKKSGIHRVKILLLQHKYNKSRLLLELVRQKGHQLERVHKRVKQLHSEGFRKCYEEDIPYSEDFEIMSGDTIYNEVSKGLTMTNTKRQKEYRPNQDNHWFAYVEPEDPEATRHQDVVGFMAFYSEDPRSASDTDSGHEPEPIAELQFVLPKVKAEEPPPPPAIPAERRERGKAFEFLAHKILSDEWRKLARVLGLEECDIDAITYKFPRDKEEQIRQMFFRWEEMVDDSSTFIPDIVEALEEARLPWHAAELKQRFSQSHDSKTEKKTTEKKRKKSARP